MAASSTAASSCCDRRSDAIPRASETRRRRHRTPTAVPGDGRAEGGDDEEERRPATSVHSGHVSRARGTTTAATAPAATSHASGCADRAGARSGRRCRRSRRRVPGVVADDSLPQLWQGRYARSAEDQRSRRGRAAREGGAEAAHATTGHAEADDRHEEGQRQQLDEDGERKHGSRRGRPGSRGSRPRRERRTGERADAERDRRNVGSDRGRDGWIGRSDDHERPRSQPGREAKQSPSRCERRAHTEHPDQCEAEVDPFERVPEWRRHGTEQRVERRGLRRVDVVPQPLSVAKRLEAGEVNALVIVRPRRQRPHEHECGDTENCSDGRHPGAAHGARTGGRPRTRPPPWGRPASSPPPRRDR